MKAIIILSLFVLSCFAGHHLRKHHDEITSAELAKILKGLSGHGGSSGSGSGSNEEFDFETNQLAVNETKAEQILNDVKLGLTDAKSAVELAKMLKGLGGHSGSSGSGSGSNEEFDFEGDQLSQKLSVEQILQLISQAIADGKSAVGLYKLLKQAGGSGSGSGSNQEFDFEADQFTEKHLTLQQALTLLSKFEAEGKDITKLIQIINARSSGNNQEFDFEADQFATKKQSKADKIQQEIQEALLAGKDVTGLLQLLKQLQSSGSGSGSNEEFDFEADQLTEKHLTLQQALALLAKFEAAGKDTTKLIQIINARSSGNNQEFDFEADQLDKFKGKTVLSVIH